MDAITEEMRKKMFRKKVLQWESKWSNDRPLKATSNRNRWLYYEKIEKWEKQQQNKV